MSDWQIGGYLAAYTGFIIIFWEILYALASRIHFCWT